MPTIAASPIQSMTRTDIESQNNQPSDCHKRFGRTVAGLAATLGCFLCIAGAVKGANIPTILLGVGLLGSAAALAVSKEREWRRLENPESCPPLITCPDHVRCGKFFMAAGGIVAAIGLPITIVGASTSHSPLLLPGVLTFGLGSAVSMFGGMTMAS